MEMQKNFGDKITVGFGTAKTAGKGDLSTMQEIPRSMKYKHNKKEIAISALKAAATVGTILAVRKMGKRK